jgi:hypothetical protein
VIIPPLVFPAESNYPECRYVVSHYAEYCYAECRYAVCHYAEYHFAECHYAKCRCAKCHYAECPSADKKVLTGIKVFSFKCFHQKFQPFMFHQKIAGNLSRHFVQNKTVFNLIQRTGGL